MTICVVCGCKDFNVDSGLFYCQECGTQAKEFREEEKDDEDVFSSGSEIRTPSKKRKRVAKKKPDGIAWLSVEAFNAILFSQVQSLINLGVSPSLKDAVLQLWALYLQKNEFCFQSTPNGDWTPTVGSVSCNARDKQVLCGATELKKRLRIGKKRRFSKKRQISSQNEVVDDVPVVTNDDENGVSSCEFDNSNALLKTYNSLPNTTLSKKTLSTCKFSSSLRPVWKKQGASALKISKSLVGKPDYMTLSKTLCFCYLGLRLIDDCLLLSDLIKLVRDGHIPYIDAHRYIPSVMKLQQSDRLVFSAQGVPTMAGLITGCARITKYIQLSGLSPRPLLPIAAFFIMSLGLPSQLILFVKSILLKDLNAAGRKLSGSASPPVMFHYEVRAMAHVLVALKFLFVLNGKFEHSHSYVVRKINALLPQANLFVWDDWFDLAKSQAEFLKFRIVNSSTICNCIDVHCLAMHYHEVMYNWTTKDQPNVHVKCKKKEFRSSLQNALSSYVTKKDFLNSVEPPTSFATLQRMRSEVAKVRSSSQYSFADISDTGVSTEGFGQHSVLYSFDHHQDKMVSKCKKIGRLFSKLQRMSKDNLPDQSEGESSQSSYWYAAVSKRSVARRQKLLPPSFLWLLEYASNLVECSSVDLYYEVTDIEKLVFALK